MSSVETKQLGARADAIELVGINHNPDSRSGEVHAEDTVRTKTSVRRTTRKRDVGESAGVRSDLFPYSAKGSTGMMVLHATATNKQSPLQEFQLVSGLGCEDGFPQFVRKLPVNPGVLATLLRAILIFKLLSGPSSVGIRFRSSWWPSISSLLTAWSPCRREIGAFRPFAWIRLRRSL